MLEAKAEDKNPLVGKEQARKYARSLNCRFVMLSNGNLHYFWDLERGNPYLTRQFSRLATSPIFSIGDYRSVPEKYRALIPEYVKDYVSLNQF